MTVFFDSSYLIALYNEKDDFHQLAFSAVKRLEASQTEFITSNIVLAETVNFLFSRKGKLFAQEFLKAFKRSKTQEVFVSRAIFQEGYKLLFAQKSKRGLNLFDCLHLATMKALEINTILTFDKEFKKWVKVVGI